MSILSLRDLTVAFGGLTAVNNVSLEVNAGEILSIIGPNGAGKTTVFNAISGVYPPTSGKVFYRGKEAVAPFSLGLLLSFLLSGLMVGCGVFLALHVQYLWTEAIIHLYVYQQSFPWGAATRRMAALIRGMPLYASALPFACGTFIGCAAAWTFWLGSRRAPERITHMGVARTFQNIRLFPLMSVLDNILAGMEVRLGSSFVHSALRLPRFWRERFRATVRARCILELVGLSGTEETLAGNLSYGLQRRLEIGRALASQPKLLLLDEPAAGLNPKESRDLLDLIRAIRDKGITIVLIEHDMKVVMAISDRIVVLDYGHKIAEGKPEEIRANPRVIEAYLGREAAHA